MREIVIILAKYFIVLSVLVIAYVFFSLQHFSEKKRFVAQAVIGGILALMLLKLGGYLFYNPRPFVVGNFVPFFPHGRDNGFPSDHALLAFFLAFLAYKYHTRASYVLLILAILIGAARVVAGVHHSLDIVGAMILSAVAVIVSQALFKLGPIDAIFSNNSDKKVSED